MMAYIWLGIYGFALMFLITLSVNSIAARFLRRFPDSKPISFISGYVLIAFYLIIALLSPTSALFPFRMGLFFSDTLCGSTDPS